MTVTFWIAVSQTVVFLAVSGFAWWASRVIAEAANSSAEAADQAVKAARDAERTATDIRKMREMVQTWLDQQQARIGHFHEQEMRGASVPTRPARTDTAEVQAVLTPQAITGRGHMESAESSLDGAARSHRGRHASEADPGWTSALRAVASRTASRIKSQED